MFPVVRYRIFLPGAKHRSKRCGGTRCYRSGLNRGCLDRHRNMTYNGHVKTSNISYFKAHLSQELKAVIKGERIVILDRDRPVAEVIPYQSDTRLMVRPPIRTLSFEKGSFRVQKDPLEYLLQDRRNR